MGQGKEINMKKFLNVVMQIKTNLSMSFTAMMCIILAVAFFMGWETLKLNYIFSILLVSIVVSIFQVVAFSDIIIKKMSYAFRLCVFAIPLYFVLSFVAIQFQWFPKENLGGWVTFSVIFFVILIVMTAGFEIYYRASGHKYDGLLGEYHKKKEKNTQE